MLENLNTKFTYQPLTGNRLRHGKFISDVQYMISGSSQIYEDWSLVVRKTHFFFLLYSKKRHQGTLQQSSRKWQGARVLTGYRERPLDRLDCAMRGTESSNAKHVICYLLLDLFISCWNSVESDEEKKGRRSSVTRRRLISQGSIFM